MRHIRWIDPFAPAHGAPPRTVMPFFRWALKGCGWALAVGSILSIGAGVIEVMAALVLGWVVDAALSTQPQSVFDNNVGLMLASLGFFLILRPLLFGISSYMQSVVVVPNVFNIVLSRLHRYTLGQAVTFFDNDFAGRISQ
ncbi:MAG: ABC transporter ATP-binding protein, partial [Sulfitobacter sp.]